MAFKLTFRKATLRTPRDTLRACGAARKAYELIVAAFSYSYPANIGASVVLAVLSVPLTVPWTIRMPITRPSSTFVVVVRFTSGGRVLRYKLWGGIGEVLPLPLYIGETLPAGAAIEIWSVPNQTAVLGSAWTLKLGVLENATHPCDQNGTDITPSVCVPGYPYEGTSPDPSVAFGQCVI